MAIRKRISGNGPEDFAIRSALNIAITASERRITALEQELKDDASFDADATQKEIDTRRSSLAVWKRLASLDGKLSVTSDAEA